MRLIWAAVLVLTASGMAAAQGYYPQLPANGALPYGYGQPYAQPAPGQRSLPAAVNSRQAQLMPYPSMNLAPPPYTARTLPADAPPERALENDAMLPPMSTATDEVQGDTKLPDPPPDANSELNELPPETDSNIPEPPPSTEPNSPGEEVIKPTPAAEPKRSTEFDSTTGPAPPELAPVPPNAMVHAVPAPTVTVQAVPVVVAEQPRVPTLLGHFFNLEQMHSVVNYAVPVHYPKQQMRGPCCYGDAYFTYFFIKRQSPPPLLLSAGGDVVVGGGTLQFDNGERTGGRFTLGTWVNYAQTVGYEVSYLAFAEREPSFFGTDLQRDTPNFDVATARVSALSRFWTAEFNRRSELRRNAHGHVDCLAGIRYLELIETLNMSTTGPVFPNPTADAFRTENYVIAAQLGLQSEWVWGCCTFNLFGKAGAGNVHERIIINDLNGTLEPTATGTYRRDRIAVTFEGGANFGVQLSNCLRLSAGYTFVYVSPVARPADQIDNEFNTFKVGDSSFWVQGINGGLEFRF